MSYSWDGERVESLAIAIMAAHGVAWDRLDPGGRSYARRSANGALHRLGGEQAGREQGLDHLLEVLADVLECGERQFKDRGMSEELQDAMAQLRLIAQVLAGIEPPQATPTRDEVPAEVIERPAPAPVAAAAEIEDCV